MEAYYMAIPTDLVCKKCGQVFGVIVQPENLVGLTAVCALCIKQATDAKGIVPNSDETWEEVLKD
jgi:hypothetical protein